MFSCSLGNKLRNSQCEAEYGQFLRAEEPVDELLR